MTGTRPEVRILSGALIRTRSHAESGRISRDPGRAWDAPWWAGLRGDGYRMGSRYPKREAA